MEINIFENYLRFFQYCEYDLLIIAHRIDTIQSGLKQEPGHAVIQCVIKWRQILIQKIKQEKMRRYEYYREYYIYIYKNIEYYT